MKLKTVIYHALDRVAEDWRITITDTKWITLKGQLKEGYRVASGPSRSYPEYGSIEKQKPYFKELGLNLDGTFNGTLNISIHPYEFRMVKSEYHFEKVKWSDLMNAENFSFSRCKVSFYREIYDGWVYFPDPKTKDVHLQSASTVEVLAPFIPNIKYGDTLEISLNEAEIKIELIEND